MYVYSFQLTIDFKEFTLGLHTHPYICVIYVYVYMYVHAYGYIFVCKYIHMHEFPYNILTYLCMCVRGKNKKDDYARTLIFYFCKHILFVFLSSEFANC